jgi:hypothetical protein
MTRADALAAAAEGIARLAAALRDRHPAEVGGVARPDPEMWLHGRVR